MEIDYKYKANKYKLKYLNLKKQIILDGGLGEKKPSNITTASKPSNTTAASKPSNFTKATQYLKKGTKELATTATNYIRTNINEMKDAMKSEETLSKEKCEKKPKEQEVVLNNEINKISADITTLRKKLGKLTDMSLIDKFNESIKNILKYCQDQSRINNILKEEAKNLQKKEIEKLQGEITKMKNPTTTKDEITKMKKSHKSDDLSDNGFLSYLKKELYGEKSGMIFKKRDSKSSDIKLKLYKNEIGKIEELQKKIGEISKDANLSNDIKKDKINSSLDTYISSPIINADISKEIGDFVFKTKNDCIIE
jgi:hypothetical protein